MRWNDRWTIALLFACLICLLATGTSLACTGLKLVGNDGTVVFVRTQEWGKFDLNPHIAAYPRNTTFQATTPDDGKGIAWKPKFH